MICFINFPNTFLLSQARFLMCPYLIIDLYLMEEQSQLAPVKCPTFTLNDGTKIPAIGLGTGAMKIENDSSFSNCKQQVKDAILKYGYRHIDTATLYGTENAIGQAL